MADDVQVIFGANIAGLIAGVEEAKQSIEGLRAPVDDFVAGLSGVAEAVGLAFAVDKIREFAVEMAELGEKTLNTAYILGLSVGEYAQLVGAFTLLGGSADGAQKTFERLAVQVQKVSEGNAQAAAHFHNLGISTEEVKNKGNDLTSLLTLTIEKYGQLIPDLKNIGELHQIAGRGVDNLAAALRSGGEGWKEALKGAEDYQRAMDENADKMADSKEHMNALTLAVMTLSTDGFALIKPAIDDVVLALKDLVDAADRATKPIDDVNREMDGWEVTFRVAIQTVRDLITIFHLFSDTLTILEKQTQEYGQITHEVFVGIKDTIVAVFTGGSIEDAYEGMTKRLLAITTKYGNEIIAEWAKVAAGIAKLFVPPPPPNVLPDVDITAAFGGKGWGIGRRVGTETGKAGPKGRKEEFTWPDEFSWSMPGLNVKELTDQQRAQDEVFKRYADAIKNQRKLGQMSAEEEATQEKQLMELKWQYDQAYFEKKKVAALGDAKTLEKIEGDEALAYEKHLTDMQNADARIAEARRAIELKTTESFTQAFEGIGSAFESMTTDIITRSSTIQSSLQKLWTGILGDFTKLISEMVSRWAASQLMSMGFGASAGPGSGLGSVFGAGIGSLFGGAGAAAAGGASLDWAAAIPFLLQHGGIIPSAAGGWSVPSFKSGGIPSILHANEMVLPAHISEGLQQMISSGGGGGHTFNLNVSAMDGASVMRHGPALVASINNAMRNGSQLRAA